MCYGIIKSVVCFVLLFELVLISDYLYIYIYIFHKEIKP